MQEKIKKIVLKRKERFKRMGNSGFVCIKDPDSKAAFVYRYGRKIEIKTEFHSEPDILSLLKK